MSPPMPELMVSSCRIAAMVKSLLMDPRLKAVPMRLGRVVAR
jgi:hypothetical protein